MARYLIPQLSPYPYHITDRCPNREHFPLRLARTWDILCDHLSLVHYKYGFRIHAFVLMPNHFHLVASVSEVPIGKILCEFLSSSSRSMNLESNRINQRWGHRSYKCEIASYHYYMNAYKYVYQNPVRAKLCTYAEEWPYSTLNGLVGLSKLQVPLESDTLFAPKETPSFDSNILMWLNRPMAHDAHSDIRTALQKKRFQLPKRKEKPNPYESLLI